MEDLQKRMKRAANLVWEYIGSDVLKTAEVDSMSREDVIEVVLDASYLEYHGQDPEAVAEFRKLSYEEQEEIMLKAFPFSRYGW